MTVSIRKAFGLDKRNKRRNRGVCGEGGAECKWPQQACTTMLFLIPKNVTSERLIALIPTLIRWWRAFRAPEVAKRQQKYRVDWDAVNIDGNGKFFLQSKRRGSKSGSFGSGPGKGLRACHLPCGLGLGDAFQFPKEDLAGVVLSFRAPEARTVRRMRRGAAPDHFGHLARVEVELFASADCIAGCIE